MYLLVGEPHPDHLDGARTLRHRWNRKLIRHTDFSDTDAPSSGTFVVTFARGADATPLAGWRCRSLSPPYPTVPSICSSISLFISTAYSIGSSFTNGSMKPPTIIVLASASERPRLIR